MGSSNTWLSQLGHYAAYLIQYSPLLHSMVSNELKGKLKYTTLGYIWHLINPLTLIVIYYTIFTVIFGKDVRDYWVYVSAGMFAFSFMQSCIFSGSSCIINNKNLVTKMAFPRELLIFSKIIATSITLVVSYVLLTILMVASGVYISWTIIYMPLIVILMSVFTAGLVLMIASISVYVRDLPYAVHLIMGCLMFAIPIMYLPSQRYTPLMDYIWHANPFYYYIEAIHACFYWGTIPSQLDLVMCFVFTSLFFIIGMIVFKKLEKKFAERL